MNKIILHTWYGLISDIAFVIVLMSVRFGSDELANSWITRYLKWVSLMDTYNKYKI